MRISDLLARDGVTFSLEVFPPKTSDKYTQTAAAAKEIAAHSATHRQRMFFIGFFLRLSCFIQPYRMMNMEPNGFSRPTTANQPRFQFASLGAETEAGTTGHPFRTLVRPTSRQLPFAVPSCR